MSGGTRPDTEGLPVTLRAPTAPLAVHFNASRLRADTWNALRTQSALLAAEPGEADHARGVQEALELLAPIETYWAFPGAEAFAHLQELLRDEEHRALALAVQRTVRALSSHSYRRRHIPLTPGEEWDEEEEERDAVGASLHPTAAARPYFEVLVVDAVSQAEEAALRAGLLAMRRPEDRFIYDIVVVPSFEDALIAVLFNHNLQAAVVRYGFPFHSQHALPILQSWLEQFREARALARLPEQRSALLGRLIGELRPELDRYLVTDVSVEEAASASGMQFRRVFYRQEDYLELHLSLLRGIGDRYRTPFFKALRRHAEQPTGVFHAMPISRGKSIVRSHWIQDMAQFYGLNIFLAETSATSGGLDSLQDPHGPIKEAQSLAARAFGSRRSFFVTNGTTTANKIVAQALLRPGDIVLVDRNCHKSLHYALALTGAHVVYLEAYPLDSVSFYGAVPLEETLGKLRTLRDAGQLHRVRALILTNCTFDGIVYDPLRVMQACLAIKPDLVFHWDEAWFAFARFSPTHRRRTAMDAAGRLRELFRDPARAAAWAAAHPEDAPEPSRVRVRVYATQSTHKTLTSLRQGSMIHVHDQSYSFVEHAFRESYMTHTSTSPNYQILASLDLGRRQVELEGFELVSKQVELAMTLRETVASHPRLKKWFRFLSVSDLVPSRYRPSGIRSYTSADDGWALMMDAWEMDEFVLDPTRLTLHVGATGIDGDTFKTTYLMEKHGIQVNKTSRNTVLFMTNIGTTRSSVAHLIDVLVKLADEMDRKHEDENPAARTRHERAVAGLTSELPPLPDFSRFHARFADEEAAGAGDLRSAYFLAVDETASRYLQLADPELDAALDEGRELVSAAFVTPYPPGFPILTPGQVVSRDILAYMRALDTKEIHGYQPDLGLRLFREDVLAKEG